MAFSKFRRIRSGVMLHISSMFKFNTVLKLIVLFLKAAIRTNVRSSIKNIRQNHIHSLHVHCFNIFLQQLLRRAAIRRGPFRLSLVRLTTNSTRRSVLPVVKKATRRSLATSAGALRGTSMASWSLNCTSSVALHTRSSSKAEITRHTHRKTTPSTLRPTRSAGTSIKIKQSVGWVRSALVP